MNNLFSLKGRVALLTGGSRGIGRMIAAGFVAQGARVYVSSRKAQACQATAADLLGCWTNGRFKSNPHRVVNSSGRERLSIAVFADPDFDTVIEPVVQPGEVAKYGPVACGDYILGRLDRAFVYRKQAPG